MQDGLVREPLERALLRRIIKPGMIIHRPATRSDRGGQYLSNKMKELVKTFKLKQSGPPRGMSRADDPYDNAWAESFWMGPPSGRLKAELAMPKGGYESQEKLKTVLFLYIDGYYNTRRLHCAGSPVVLKLFEPGCL